MQYLLLLILLFTSPLLPAQKAETIWSATTSVDLSTSKKRGENQRTQKVVYHAPEANQADLSDVDETSIGQQFFAAFLKGEVEGFHDSELEKLISKEEVASLFKSKDTVTIVDPINYEVTYEVVSRDLNPADFTGIRLLLKLVLTDDGGLQQNVVAVSLLQKGEARYFENLYFKPEYLTEAINLKNPAWSIVDRTRFDIPLTDIVTAASSPYSQDEALRFLDQLIAKTKGKDFSETLDWSPLTPDAAIGILGTLDTVTIVDPITYEVSYEINEKGLFYERVDGIRLHQFWAWDGNSKRFIISPIGYTPLSFVTDETDKHLYTSPIVSWAYPWYRKR